MDCIGDPERLALLSDDGRLRLARCTPLLVQAYAARAVANTWPPMWRHYGYSWGGPAGCQDDTDLRAVRQFLLALRELEQSQPALDAAQLQALAARPARWQATARPEAPSRCSLSIMPRVSSGTAVFLPGLGRRVRNDTPPLLRWLQLPAGDGSQDLLMAVRSIGEQVSSDPLSDYIKQLQKLRQDNERRRLAYVAVTRARGQLYLSGHAPWREKEQQPRPDARSQLHILWPALEQQFIAAAGAGPQVAQVGEGTASINAAAPWVSPRCDLHPRATAHAAAGRVSGHGFTRHSNTAGIRLGRTPGAGRWHAGAQGVGIAVPKR